MVERTIDELQPGDHVCWTFDDDDLLLKRLARSIMESLDSDQKVLCFTDAVRPRALLAELEDVGVPVSVPLGTGQLRMRTPWDSYLATGGFDPVAMTRTWHTEIAACRQEGWAGLLAVGDMAWAARPVPGAERLPWYEAQVNQVFSAGYASALCLYDRKRFPDTVLDLIRAAHPGSVAVERGETWEPPLRMRYTTDPVGLRFSGEIDLSNRQAATAVLTGLVDRLRLTDAEEAVLDLSELRFLDATMAATVIRVAREMPGRLRLVGCSRPVVRLLELVAVGVPASLVVELAA